MGQVLEEITLTNAGDNVRIETGTLTDARQVTVQAIVDTGASTLIINEELQQKLGLKVTKKTVCHFANGKLEKCGVTEPVNIRWKNRLHDCNAIVVPEAKKVLLGAIPLEGMDLIVDPVRQQLAGAHGDKVMMMAL